MEEHINALENRLDKVERSVDALREDISPVVEELKEAVQDFRRRLHEAEKLFWFSSSRGGMGHSDEPLDASIHPYWRHVKYRRKVEEEYVEVVSKFNDICNTEIDEATQTILRLPSFNTWAWEDYQLILLLQHMYVDLGLTKTFNIDMEVLRSFLCNVYLNYNQVPFHNFRHAFSVAQMMYGMVCKCDLQRRLGDLNILILITSCICHDLDHPGFNNIYQINAKTELALRYNDISPLENHHCAVAFSILEKNYCNILRELNVQDYKIAREGIIRCVLATDMARHNEILSEFRDIVDEFDFDNKSHINLLFMILIKVADISNEARPLDIAEPWLECLMQEFFNQSDLEKMEGLPVSPFMDREKVTKPSSQCSFIGFVLLPLFEALGEVLTELDELIIEPVREALEYYRSLNEDTKKETDEKEEKESPEEKEEEEEDGGIETEAVEEERDPSSPSNLKKILSKTESFTSLRSRTSSRTSGLLRAASSRETDPEFDGTETEVEVSERTSKFKISTEASRRNSCERKGSIDRRYSVDRTVSPHSLVERLRPHVETEVEASFPAESEQEILNEDIQNVDQKIEWQSASIFNKIRYLSGRLSVDFDNKPDSTLVAEKHRKYSTPIIQGVLKRKKENESAENSRNLFSSQKTHISFATSECESIEVGRNGSREPLISKQNDPSLEDKKPVITDTVKDKKCEELKRDDSSNVESSPTHSEKIISSPNSFLRQKKKFSLSLDVLPRRNGKPKKESSQTQRVSSDDLLSRTSRSNSKKLCQNSPKSLKKKHESAKAILLRSFSFRRRSSSKSEDQVPMTAVECTKSDDL